MQCHPEPRRRRGTSQSRKPLARQTVRVTQITRDFPRKRIRQLRGPSARCASLGMTRKYERDVYTAAASAFAGNSIVPLNFGSSGSWPKLSS